MKYAVSVSGTEYTRNLDESEANLFDMSNYAPFEKFISKIDEKHVFIGHSPIVFCTKKDAQDAAVKYKAAYLNTHVVKVVEA